jgi:shikimate kinase
MGAGKSTTGKKLAVEMNYRFVDLDHCIESKEQMSIPEIFKNKGESYFRQLEHDLILEFTTISENLIVSTGGGAPCYMNNMELLNSTGITIYLKLDPEIIFDRLTRARKKNRPLIDNMPPNDLMQFIIDKLKEREPVYSRSHLIVKGENLDILEIERWIMSYISNSADMHN